uniref:Uncharacterized protein n=1 Tax=Citrobacter freundii TaxID=546 RepID=A0A0K2CS02_CITFR|nr:hypothetical protein p112298KPC_065 [Citrobacter freundii]
MSRCSAIPARPPRCYGRARDEISCGLRLTPCLHFSPTAAYARHVAGATSTVTRSQLFLMIIGVLPVVFLLKNSQKNRPDRLCFICAAASASDLASSAFRRAVVSARRKPVLR